MNRSKLFVDAHVFDGVYQGTTTYLSGLYNSLVHDDNFEITLAANNIENLREHFKDPRFRFLKLPSKSKVRRLAFDIPRILRKGEFEYAHFQYITPMQKCCKYINTIHDLLFLDYPEQFPFFYRASKKALFKQSAINSDFILTVSEFSKSALQHHFDIDQNRITVTPNAVSIYHEATVDVKRKYSINRFILYVSRFEPRKNHYLLLKSFLDLRLYDAGYHLVFIGKANDVWTESYNMLYSKLEESIKKMVLHFENIPKNELNGFYKQAELFVYPSLAEGFGIPPLEAAISNCKVLCSNQTAMRDFVFFGQYLFDPRDESEFKTKLMQILDDQNYPYNPIRNLILARYNWDNAANILAKTIYPS